MILAQIDLTTGSIPKTLLRFAFPMICGNLLQQLYNVADTLIVGRFLGSDALGAVGSSYTLMTFLTSILLGLCVSVKMVYTDFLQFYTLLVMGLGLLGFVMDSVGGVMFAKFLNLFRKEKINPMVGAAGISAFPMSSRVIQKMATEEDPGNFILMQAAGANVAGQIASVVAGGLVLGLLL